MFFPEKSKKKISNAFSFSSLRKNKFVLILLFKIDCAKLEKNDEKRGVK